MNQSVIAQVRTAWKNKLAFCLGSVMGGIVTVGIYTEGHYGDHSNTSKTIMYAGLLYSAITVYQWGMSAFQMRAKAIGFVVLMEGLMTFSSVPALSIVCLLVLAGINAVSAGCNLARDNYPSSVKKTKAVKQSNKKCVA